MEWLTTSLVLDRLLAGESGAWELFLERFKKPILAFARRRGLADDRAEDVLQETLAALLEGLQSGAFDRSQGRLGHWLFGIAANKVRQAAGRAAREERDRAGNRSETGFLDGLAAEPDEQAWERAWEQALLEQCFAQARAESDPRAWRAFEMFVVEGKPAAAVGAELGMSANAVFLAKYKIAKRLKELRAAFESVA